MLRVTFLIRRRQDLTADAFYDYWRHEHGPLVASFSRKLNFMRYVQVHTLADSPDLAGPRGAMEPAYDGVAEVYYESRAAFAATFEDRDARAAGSALVEDERNFIDFENSTVWVGYEYPQVNPTPENMVAAPRSGLVKLYYPLRAPEGRDDADAQTYWRTHHGPIIRRHTPAQGVLRYVQVHRALDEPLDAPLRKSRGCKAPYLGHAELWFDRAALGVATPERQAAAKAAYEDERNFIDFGRSAMWLAKEHVFFDRR
ncbi:MAG: EthD domain-containing protein [Pseudomonadota bacterium]